MTDQTDDKDESMDQVPDEPTPTDDNAAETGGGDTPSGAAAPDTNAEGSEATGDSAAAETEASTESAATDADGSADAPAAGDDATSGPADADADAGKIAATGDSAAAGTDVEASTEDGTASSGETDLAATDGDDMESAWADALAETEGADSQAGVAETAMTQPRPAVPESVTHPADFPEFGSGHQGTTPANMDLLMDVKLPVSIELGRTTLEIIDILKWGPGSIVELDKLAGEPVNLLVNNKLVAKGEVVVVDENFGLRITSLVKEQDSQEGR